LADGNITLSGTPTAVTPAGAQGYLTLTGLPEAEAPVFATGTITLAGEAVADEPEIEVLAGVITLSGGTFASAPAAFINGRITLSGTAQDESYVPPEPTGVGAGVRIFDNKTTLVTSGALVHRL
jgi:hypothetical protein